MDQTDQKPWDDEVFPRVVCLSAQCPTHDKLKFAWQGASPAITLGILPKSAGSDIQEKLSRCGPLAGCAWTRAQGERRGWPIALSGLSYCRRLASSINLIALIDVTA